jgi:hypothetical protein
MVSLKQFIGGSAITMGLMFALPAQSATLSFHCITGNLAGDCAIGENQLSVEVTDAGNQQVEFLFNNTGTESASIEGVYFDDGTLLGIASINNGPGVQFSQGATPAELPGANQAEPSFVTTQNFLADSDAPVSPNGVNPGESLGIVFDLQSGTGYSDVISQLTTGELRIGLHVIAFDSGGSESFVNNAVPLPAAAWLLLSAIFGLGAFTRRVHG